MWKFIPVGKGQNKQAEAETIAALPGKVFLANK